MPDQLIAQALVGGGALLLNTIVRGLAIGGVYAIIALGFVIIFKATQVVNFAQGALAAVGGLFVSFLVFDQASSDVPRGQTPFTWWQAPFAGDGLPEVNDQWASVVLVAVIAGVVTSLLGGRSIPGWAFSAFLATFLGARWLSTRAGFTFLDPPLLSLIVALAAFVGVGIARGWRPNAMVAIATVATFGLQIVIALISSTWIDWFGNLAIGLLFGALLGIALERSAIRPMIGKPLFSLAVITLGLEIIIRQTQSDSVRVLNRPVQAPWAADPFDPASDGGFRIGGAFFDWSWIAILIAALACFVLVNVFYRTKLGVAMRAVSFDQEAGMAQGINVGQVFAIAWAFGTGLAVLGGVFATQPPISQAGAVTASTALVAFRALPAVILGGLDSVKGALIGGLLIGLAEGFAGEYLSGFQDILGAGYAQIVPYVVMLIVLLVRPFGLYGTPEVRRV